MKKIVFFVFFFSIFMVSSCKSSKSTSNVKSELNKDLNEKNRGSVSLLDQIRRKSGIIIRNGVPILNKTANSFSSNSVQPLYVLNSYIVGSSFRTINQLVDNFNVKEIKVLSGSDASEFGSRAANGVIIIITYN